MASASDLAGEVVVVTGAASALGQRVVRAGRRRSRRSPGCRPRPAGPRPARRRGSRRTRSTSPPPTSSRSSRTPPPSCTWPSAPVPRHRPTTGSWATAPSPAGCSTPPPRSARSTSCSSPAPRPTAPGPTTPCRSPRTHPCARTPACRSPTRRPSSSAARPSGATPTRAPPSPCCGPTVTVSAERQRLAGQGAGPLAPRCPSPTTSPGAVPRRRRPRRRRSTSPGALGSTGRATWRPTAGSAATPCERWPAARRGSACPERLAVRLAGMRWRWGLAPTPPALLPFTVHPWVVANDRLRADGWEPTSLQRGGLRRRPPCRAVGHAQPPAPPGARARRRRRRHRRARPSGAVALARGAAPRAARSEPLGRRATPGSWWGRRSAGAGPPCDRSASGPAARARRLGGAAAPWARWAARWPAT